MEEGADHLRASSQTAQSQADAVFQPLQIGRALPGQGVVFHPSPQPFVGIQFRGIGGQAVDTQALAVFPQWRPGSFSSGGCSARPRTEKSDRGSGAADGGGKRSARRCAPYPALSADRRAGWGSRRRGPTAWASRSSARARASGHGAPRSCTTWAGGRNHSRPKRLG